MDTPVIACDTLIRAGVLVTQDAERTVIEDAALAVADGLVAACGAWADVAPACEAAHLLDLSERLVLPGLVNTHTHAAMTAFRGLADDLPLMTWLTEHIWPVEGRLTPEVVFDGTLLACAEMLASGTTCFVDQYLFMPHAAEACERMGIRGVLGSGVLSFATRAYDTPDEAFRHIEAFTADVDGSRLVRTAVVPHAAYTTTPEVMRESFALAESLDILWSTHAAENAEETALCLKKFGKRPLPYLQELGVLTPRALLAHVVDATDDELAMLAATGAHVAHNPRSNMKLANGVAPAEAYRRHGIGFGLGTDGAGSNNSLNMFKEMSATALTQKAHTGDATAMPAQAVLDAATRHGAHSAGWPELGRLAPGAPADLTALDLTHPGLAPLYNPVSQAVYAATGGEVRLTMVNGRVVYEDGRLTGADPRELAACAARLAAWARGD